MKLGNVILLIAAMAMIISCETGQKKNGGKIKDGPGVWKEDGYVRGKGNYKNSKKDGRWVLYHPSSTAKLGEGDYAADQQTGKWVFFYKTGEKQTEGSFINGQRTGEWLEYHKNGKRKSKGSYVIKAIKTDFGEEKMGVLEGHKQSFYESGKVWLEEDYKNGKLNGKKQEYFEDGRPKEISEYVDDEKTGKSTTFHKNGSRKEVLTFAQAMIDKRDDVGRIVKDSKGLPVKVKKAVPNGKYESYHENGNMSAKGEFTMGKQSGHWQIFSRDNRLQKEGDYKDGKETGLWKFYEYEGGRRNVRMELTVIAGMANGKGKLYKKGALVGEGVLNGIPRPELKNEADWTGKWQSVPKKNGQWTEFYPGGQKKFEGNCLMDKLNGKYTEYYQNGKIKAKGEYMNNKMNGMWTFYNQDGSEDREQSGRYSMGKKMKQ